MTAVVVSSYISCARERRGSITPSEKKPKLKKENENEKRKVIQRKRFTIKPRTI
jgi:hypothetical protein